MDQFILADEKYVQLEHYFVDGTKIEANANRYTFVWGKAVVKHKAKLQEKVQTLFATIEEAENQEEQSHASQDLSELGEMSEITSEKLETAVQQLEERLQATPSAILGYGHRKNHIFISLCITYSPTLYVTL
ncbi:hypothetical protein NSU08_35480 [Paenibacillus sp. FSL H7-0331]|uniref:hypothetical protein n=1 Tax=Paenibacillus sp. FSL H7-0331 TaxID=1920421 RepID=UPI0030FB532E